MNRFSLLRDDTSLTEAAEALDRLRAQLPRLHDRQKILETALTELSTLGAVEDASDDESYGYIPIDLGEFFEAMFDLEAALAADADYAHSELRHRPVAFLEIGCGSGRNVFLLSATDRFHFESVHGFDTGASLVAHGRALFGLGKALFVEDARSFDYGGYDAIYFYRPFSEDAAQLAFEDHLVGSMRRGAYLVGMLAAGLEEDRRLLQKDEAGRVWKRL